MDCRFIVFLPNHLIINYPKQVLSPYIVKMIHISMVLYIKLGVFLQALQLLVLLSKPEVCHCWDGAGMKVSGHLQIPLIGVTPFLLPMNLRLV
ncbi:MAG: hypothetical protein ACD_73C00220G0002 [uncultured bacterium]|nr:MAG: hypothetical protein ACD_73C00220G0002 [uncultured bacterium]